MPSAQEDFSLSQNSFDFSAGSDELVGPQGVLKLIYCLFRGQIRSLSVSFRLVPLTVGATSRWRNEPALQALTRNGLSANAMMADLRHINSNTSYQL